MTDEEGIQAPHRLELSRWGGEFKDPAIEAEFQGHIREHESRQFVVALQTAGPLYFAFVLSDYLALGPTSGFLINFMLRLAILLYCWSLALRLRTRRATVPQLYRLSLWFFLIVLSDAFVIYPFSQRGFLEVYPGLLVVLVGAFFFVPSTLGKRLIAMAYALTGVVVEAAVWFPPAPRDIPLSALFFVATLTFCVVASIQHARLRRLSFIDALHNRQLAGLLQRENNLRRRLEETAKRQARTDELTGLPNRRSFIELAERELSRARRYDSPLAIMMFDLDYFKAVNDQHGHAAGDSALRAIAECCSGVLRANDVIGRLGGEEFAVLLPQTTPAGARNLAERMRAAVAHCPVYVHDGEELFVSATIGVATMAPGQAITLDELLAQADNALYEGKAQGRNRVRMCEQLPE